MNIGTQYYGITFRGVIFIDSHDNVLQNQISRSYPESFF